MNKSEEADNGEYEVTKRIDEEMRNRRKIIIRETL
jgi:hypothetical protein